MTEATKNKIVSHLTQRIASMENMSERCEQWGQSMSADFYMLVARELKAILEMIS